MNKEERKPTPPKWSPKPELERPGGLHWDSRALDGHQKAFNFAIGPREPGKTTYLYTKAWHECCKGRTLVYLVRNINNICDELIYNEIRLRLCKFFDGVPMFTYSKKDAMQGNVTVYGDGWPLIRIIALAKSVDSLKKVLVMNPSFMMFDEFLKDPLGGDHYLKAEASLRFKELYTTLKREKPNLKCYFLGNIYSLYNPYFLDLGVDTRKLRKGKIYSHNNYAVEMVTLKPELKKKLIEENPFYKFDDFYTKYALSGDSLNDEGILIDKVRPRDFSLRFVFRLGRNQLAVHGGQGPGYWYYVAPFEGKSKKKALAFDVKDMVEHTVLLDSSSRNMLGFFRSCFHRREVAFHDVNCYYLVEEIYKAI